MFYMRAIHICLKLKKASHVWKINAIRYFIPQSYTQQVVPSLILNNRFNALSGGAPSSSDQSTGAGNHLAEAPSGTSSSVP